ncbi:MULTISPECIES: carboxylesterase family protein [unclassified Novosphingobium]|uniref:carboxylesterase/lipase family protein n=1 Tax=unclassified Novosphingobium TaxID=2644732 RepID=UPI0025F07EE7|nr:MULTISPECIES: carboxylesterase family protein [unclassified Novosphingobium]
MDKALISKALIGIAASTSLLSVQALAQQAQTTSGALHGVDMGNGVAVFMGVPYAAPPLGENRWRAPQPVQPWKGTRDAGNFAPDCAQAPFPPDAAPIRTKPSEDCLYLNVWKPAKAGVAAKLPVMVWVHGGGFVNGGTSPAVYTGDNFARDGIVLVSINYRLGRYGFFAHPALADEGFGGNFGFLDQIAALKWVQANIAAFGGDPANVTVFGESAGGMSMHMLLQAPEARGLFHKVIIQSGGGRDMTLPMPTMARAAKAGEEFAPGLDAAALRALPAEKVTGDLSMMTMTKPGYSGPMIDGRTIFGSSIDAINAGLYAKVPVMVGANSADGFPLTTDKAAIFGEYAANAAEARRLYDPDGKTPGLVVATMTSADRMFIEPARAVARALAARGHTAYHFRFGYAHPQVKAVMGGAPHASEIPYVFDTVVVRTEPTASAPGEDTVAQRTHDLWVNFARTGVPSPAWPVATAGDTKVMLIDESGAKHTEDPYRARLDFAESLIVGK